MIEIKKLKPTSPGTRHVVRVKSSVLSKEKPHRKLLESKRLNAEGKGREVELRSGEELGG